MRYVKPVARLILRPLRRCLVLLAAAKTWLLRTDLPRWKRVSKQPPPWDERNRLLAALVPPGAAVLDLGCGAQTLRVHLKPGCHYQPCDIIPSSPDVIHCDFNSGNYPVLNRKYDFVVCSGVFEYTREPVRFIHEIKEYGRVLLLSFNPRRPAESLVGRFALGWVNHLSQDQIEGLFSDNGLVWRLVRRKPVPPAGDELIYELRRGDAQVVRK